MTQHLVDSWIQAPIVLHETLLQNDFFMHFLALNKTTESSWVKKAIIQSIIATMVKYVLPACSFWLRKLFRRHQMFGKKSILWFVNRKNNTLQTIEGSSFQSWKALPIAFHRKLIRLTSTCQPDISHCLSVLTSRKVLKHTLNFKHVSTKFKMSTLAFKTSVFVILLIFVIAFHSGNPA